MRRNYNSEKRGSASILDAGNQILIIVVAGLLGYVVIKFFSPQQVLLDSTLERSAGDQEIAARDIAASAVKPFKIYEKGIKARGLFEPLKSSLKPDLRALQKALPALHKRIRLIGILMDSDPKAIVEDLKEKQTHFLSKGENLGAVFLEDIREDKVIFKYDNERIEMAL